LALAHGAAWAGGWKQAEYLSGGKPITTYECAPADAPPHPAVVILHGAAPRGGGYPFYERVCADLASAGYYAQFIEFYSQTPAVLGGQSELLGRYFPEWVRTINDGIDALRRNGAVDAKRVGIIGYSLGAYLGLSVAALAPDKVAAVVEYYGGLPPSIRAEAKRMPPVLILHGDADSIVPVSEAKQLAAMLDASRSPHEVRIYKGAEHAFNFPGARRWYDARHADDAWQLTLEFLAKYLKPTLEGLAPAS
jgi:carboxymethylenebutenolidase